MRIAIITDLWPPFPGGAERFVFNISRELKRRGHEIFVLTSYANAAEFDGIKPTWKSIGVRAYDSEPGHGHADGWHDIFSFLLEHRAEAIFTHHFFASEFEREFFAKSLSDFPRLPVIQLVHNGKRNPSADIAIFNSQYTADRGDFKAGDMVILPPAFEDIMANGRGSHIGFIKPIPHKGVDFMYRLAERLPHRDFMVLHGEWQETEDIRRGKKNVFFMPPVHTMPTFYEKCKMVLVPSLQEDAGTVPQECALNGIPCISSNVMGLAETNKGGIVLPLEEQRWINAIESLYDIDLYNDVVNRQRAYIKSLNWPAQFDELSDKINRLGHG